VTREQATRLREAIATWRAVRQLQPDSVPAYWEPLERAAFAHMREMAREVLAPDGIRFAPASPSNEELKSLARKWAGWWPPTDGNVAIIDDDGEP